MTNFKIIIPVYNCAHLILKSMQIIAAQTHTAWQCAIINDASTDQTKNIVEKFAAENPKFKIINNPKNVGVGANIMAGISAICSREDDVVVIVDGDDRLIDNGVLDRLNREYENPDVWLTYGQYVTAENLALGRMVPGCNKPLTDIMTTRRVEVNFSHLKTFKYHLWKHVSDADLRGRDGGYIKSAFDVALMVPMVELAGIKHVKFIDTILYVYNMGNNGAHEFLRRPRVQQEENLYIRSLPRKKALYD